MAVTLGSYDFTHDPTPPPPVGSRRYPWAEWFDGQIWRIYAGEDFTIDPYVMERTVRSRASDKGLRVRVRHEDGALVFQATPRADTPTEVVEEAPAPAEPQEAPRRLVWAMAGQRSPSPVETQEAPSEPSVAPSEAPDFGDVVEHRIVRPKLPPA